MKGDNVLHCGVIHIWKKNNAEVGEMAQWLIGFILSEELGLIHSTHVAVYDFLYTRFRKPATVF